MSRELLNQLREARGKATSGEWIAYEPHPNVWYLNTADRHLNLEIASLYVSGCEENSDNVKFLKLAANSILPLAEYVEGLEADLKSHQDSVQAINDICEDWRDKYLEQRDEAEKMAAAIMVLDERLTKFIRAIRDVYNHKSYMGQIMSVNHIIKEEGACPPILATENAKGR